MVGGRKKTVISSIDETELPEMPVQENQVILTIFYQDGFVVL
jgi:hypothetical protein